MSLEPRNGHLRITAMEDGRVVYDGPGEVHFGLDPAARSGLTRSEVDEIARELPVREDEGVAYGEISADLTRWDEAVRRVTSRRLPPDWAALQRADWDAAFARNEEAIASARSEFPYDPLEYGRVYPGDAGTSHWTPPDDPDEPVRSCP